MNTPPDLDPELLRAALRTRWAFDAKRLDYAKVGFGSHHWVASSPAGDRRFVTVDDLVGHHLDRDPDGAHRALDRAFRAARALREGGLAFVVAPLPTADGCVLERLNGHFSVSVLPYVAGSPGRFGAYESAAERRGVLERLAVLHAATDLVEGLAGAEDFRLAGRGELAAALRRLDRPWQAGPYSEPARELLGAMAPNLQAALTLYDQLAVQVRAAGEPFVVTHGEPHRANVIFTADGAQLIDWDTILLAPAARDLWMLVDFRAGESAALSLYRLAWDLKDIAAYVGVFGRPHTDSEDTAKAWRGLEHCSALETYRRLTVG